MKEDHRSELYTQRLQFRKESLIRTLDLCDTCAEDNFQTYSFHLKTC